MFGKSFFDVGDILDRFFSLVYVKQTISEKRNGICENGGERKTKGKERMGKAKEEARFLTVFYFLKDVLEIR